MAAEKGTVLNEAGEVILAKAPSLIRLMDAKIGTISDEYDGDVHTCLLSLG